MLELSPLLKNKGRGEVRQIWAETEPTQMCSLTLSSGETEAQGPWQRDPVAEVSKAAQCAPG